MLRSALSTAAAGAAGGGYQISRSLRFNSADSAYLSRTPAVNGSQTTATLSVWIKRSNFGNEDRIFTETTGSGTGLFWLFFDTTNQLKVVINGATGAGLTSSQVFPDPSAWYHIVAAVDTTQATSTDRIKLYVNGVQITAFSGTQTYYSLNETLKFNVTTTTNYIGYNNAGTLKGYLAETHWIDGQALTPSSFGETDATTGVWKPIRYAGTYGTNGFHLTFSDNSNTTAATLGKDSSGNGNNWTPSGSPGFSVAAGAGNDSLVDSPTQYGTDTGAGGEVRGNYCTMNPLDTGSVIALSNGNLDASAGTSQWNESKATVGMSSGKWYWEFTMNSGVECSIGIATSASPITGGTLIGFDANSWGYYRGGTKYHNNVSTAYGDSYAPTDIIGVAFDADNGNLFFYKNGTVQNSGTAAFTGLTSGPYFPAISLYGAAGSFNFGQRAFSSTAPSGFKALCTTNLPDPTILKGNQHFNTAPYEGTSSSGNAITVGFQPDLVWIKRREVGGYPHVLMDAVRGFSGTDARVLQANDTAAEVLNGAFESFDSNGFTVGGTNPTSGAFNSGLNNFFVSWNWKANGAGSLNEVGSIPSTVSANQTAGISIVTYNSGASGDKTVGHGLGVAPSMIITKSRTSASFNWVIYHASVATTVKKYLTFTTDALSDNGSNIWGSAFPTTSVFGITSGNGVVASTDCIAYCFAEVESFSKFGSYTGNGSSDGPFIFTGFRPAWVMFKTTSSLGGIQNYASWLVQDSIRNLANPVSYTTTLFANKTYEEGLRGEGSTAGTYLNIDFLSNGFKLLGNSAEINASGATVIYAAFAENPFKNALAR